MNYSIKKTERELEKCLNDYPYNHSSIKSISEKNIEATDGGFSFNLKQQWLDGIVINFGRYSNKRETSFVAFKDEPSIEMCFALKGDAFVTVEKSKKLFSAGHHNCVHHGRGKIIYDFTTQDTAIEELGIRLTPSYFSRLANTDCSELARMHDHISKGESTSLGNRHQPITLPMQKVISDILSCDKSAGLKHLFLESRVLDLLMLQVEQFGSSKTSASGIKAYDIEKIYYVKEMLDKNICTPCSLIDLAHQAGLNEFKLKKGFREVFDSTVFGYLTEIRMQRAKTMLLEQKLDISDVADYCGFQHSKNFVAAFKKYWGITPAQMLK